MQRYDKPGNLDSAMSALESALKTDPRFALGYAQLGEAYRLKYQLEMNPKLIDEALANCQKAVQLDDRLASAYVTLGRIHERGGNHELAVQEFQHALDLDHRNAEALSGMAHSYETAGRIAEAETTYKKVVALRPDYWDGYDELGLFYDRQNKYAEAIEQVRHAVELTPDNAQAYSNLGAIYIDADDPKLHPEAEKALKKSVELGPSYPAYANLASLLYDEKRYAEAAAMNEKALQLNSENYMVWNWLRNDYIWLKDQTKADAAQERALQLVEREVKLKPQDGLVQAVLASIYAKKEVRDKARSRLQTALALSPDDPDVLEYAAATYEKLGDRSQAIEFAHKALKKGYSLARLQNDPDMQSLLSDPNFHPNGK
jgi:serine/threonine-protein kinase